MYVFIVCAVGNLVDIMQHVASKYGNPSKLKRCARGSSSGSAPLLSLLLRELSR